MYILAYSMWSHTLNIADVEENCKQNVTAHFLRKATTYEIKHILQAQENIKPTHVLKFK